ncbi:DUF3152 domain-containing protein [Streptomyces sp. NPDC052309]|uniref:DUF3152 domain-containing protein n=1 Tax=Streptomyces sp. NPDC052309 TaxID=3155421 RepID=UPI003421D8BC
MNEHRSTSPPSAAAHRRRRKGRARRRRGGRPALWVGLAAVVLLLAGGMALKGRTGSGHPDGAAAPTSTVQGEASPGASARTVSSAPSGSAEKKNDEKKEEDEKKAPASTASIPASGPGTFATARGGSGHVGGSQRMLTYRVEVEDGIGISPDEVAAEVEDILADPRGWTADGKVGFRRVSGDASDFRVRLATAGTVDRICGEYGLDTGGEVNCNVGQNVMVNLKRWLLATQYYADDVPSYRALIINHEVGHFLGHGHETCPGTGRLAPVMMQQIKGLHGCKVNVWPYDASGRPITGPAVP